MYMMKIFEQFVVHVQLYKIIVCVFPNSTNVNQILCYRDICFEVQKDCATKTKVIPQKPLCLQMYSDDIPISFCSHI